MIYKNKIVKVSKVDGHFEIFGECFINKYKDDWYDSFVVYGNTYKEAFANYCLEVNKIIRKAESAKFDQWFSKIECVLGVPNINKKQMVFIENWQKKVDKIIEKSLQNYE